MVNARMPDSPGHPVLIDIESFSTPYAQFASVRDDEGSIVDFVYVAVNDAAVRDYELSREVLIGSRLTELDERTGDGRIFDDFVRLVETGEDLLMLDYKYENAPPDGATLYYDISARKVGDGLSVIWWNVTRRYEKDREVARAERETRAIVESLLDPLNVYEAVRDERGRIVDLMCLRVNAASCAYLGVTREQSEGHRVLETAHGEAAEVLIAWCRHVLLTGQPVVLDGVPLTLPNGKRRRYDVRAVQLGEGVSITYRDVTGRVRAAQEMAEAKERYRLVAENASEMVFQSGNDGRIEWVSPSVQWVLGWPPKGLIGRRFSEFINPDDIPLAVAAQKNLIASGAREGRVEVRMLTKDGEYRWMSVLGKAILDEDGKVLGGVDAVRDIQESRDAQAALMESEERFRRAMDDSAIGMAIVSPEGRYLRVNPAMTQILQRSEQELLNCTWQDLTDPEDLDGDQQLADEVLRGERDTYRLAKRYLRPDGSVVWAELAVSCVRKDNGEVLHYFSQIVDMTESVTARKALAKSEEHYRLIAENSLDVVFRASPSGHIIWISPSVTEVLGWQPWEVLGMSILRFLKKSDLTEQATDARSPHRIELEGRVLCKDGTYRWVDIISRPVLDDSGIVVSRVGRLRDIAEKKEAEEALRRSEELFRTAMASAPTGMAVVSLDRRFLQVNEALCNLLGRDEKWLLDHGLPAVLDTADDQVDLNAREAILGGAVVSTTMDHQMIHADGRRVLVEHSIGLLRDTSGQPSGFVSQFADVTESRRAREQLRFLATHDSLTELLNRRELLVQVSGILEQKPRTGDQVGILFVDLDHLKPINDTYGHAAGDEVIVTVARRIRAQLRATDLVARFGGDEFVVVLPAVHTAADVERIAGMLHDEVRKPIEVNRAQIRTSLSIGGVIVAPGSEPNAVLRLADQALYRAKRDGRDRTVMVDSRHAGA